jgi:hypothetical protein
MARAIRLLLAGGFLAAVTHVAPVAERAALGITRVEGFEPLSGSLTGSKRSRTSPALGTTGPFRSSPGAKKQERSRGWRALFLLTISFMK